MKKKSAELKKGDKILIAGKKGLVESVEISDIGKQGKRKVRLELLTEIGEKVVIIRPDDYPFDLA